MDRVPHEAELPALNKASMQYLSAYEMNGGVGGISNGGVERLEPHHVDSIDASNLRGSESPYPWSPTPQPRPEQQIDPRLSDVPYPRWPMPVGPVLESSERDPTPIQPNERSISSVTSQRVKRPTASSRANNRQPAVETNQTMAHSNLTRAEQIILLRIAVNYQTKYKKDNYTKAYEFFQEQLNKSIDIPYYAVRSFMASQMNARVKQLKRELLESGTVQQGTDYLQLLDKFIERVKQANPKQKQRWYAGDDEFDERGAAERAKQNLLVAYSRKRRAEDNEDESLTKEATEVEDFDANEEPIIDNQPQAPNRSGSLSAPPTARSSSSSTSPAPRFQILKKQKKEQDLQIAALSRASAASAHLLVEGMAHVAEQAFSPVRQMIESINQRQNPEEVTRFMETFGGRLQGLEKKVDDYIGMQLETNRKSDRILELLASLEGRSRP